MTKLIDKIENFCIQKQIFAPKEHLLIACSGGADSLALVDIFRQFAPKYDLQIAVAHAEHGIRDKASLEDAQFVQAYCAKYNLPFYLEHLNVIQFAKQHKHSTETAARILRYRFLRKVKAQIGASKILTAHHLNDQAETILQHLMRGCGAEGFAGMKIINGDIARPFLCITRREIENYCVQNNLNPRFDETNASLDYERNRIRLELLPQMESYNPQIVKSLCKSAELISAEHDFIEMYTANLYADICLAKGRAIELDVLKLKNEHKAIRYNLYRYIIQKIQGNVHNISLIHIDNIDKFLYNGHVGLCLQLPADLKISYQYGKLVFARENISQEGNYTLHLSAKIDESTILPDGQIIEIKTVLSTATLATCGRNHCLIDADKVQGKLIIRSRKDGDRISPKGMDGSKKVKNIFIDNKIPANLRPHIPLICDERGIIWIAGMQQDKHYLVDKHSKHILYLKIIK